MDPPPSSQFPNSKIQSLYHGTIHTVVQLRECAMPHRLCLAYALEDHRARDWSDNFPCSTALRLSNGHGQSVIVYPINPRLRFCTP